MYIQLPLLRLGQGWIALWLCLQRARIRENRRSKKRQEKTNK
jgi:hypothetical protein